MWWWWSSWLLLRWSLWPAVISSVHSDCCLRPRALRPGVAGGAGVAEVWTAEWAGSGIVICGGLRVDMDATTGISLRADIAKAHAGGTDPQQLRVFVGHGGPEVPMSDCCLRGNAEVNRALQRRDNQAPGARTLVVRQGSLLDWLVHCGPHDVHFTLGIACRHRNASTRPHAAPRAPS